MGKQLFELKEILTVPTGDLVCCDYHPEFGIAYVVKLHGRCLLVVNGLEWREWDDSEWPRVWNIRLFGRERVVVWNVPGGIAAVSRTEWSVIPIGEASNVLVSPNYIFVAYSEDSSLIAKGDQLEGNIVSVFSKEGELILSVSEKLKNLTYEGTFMEVSQACATQEDVFFFLAHQTPHIWKLNAANGTLEPGPAVEINEAIALSVDYETIHLLGLRGDRCTVRSFDKGNYSARESKIDRATCGTLLQRAVEFKPVFGVEGGTFLTVGNGAVDLLTPYLEHRNERSS
jgi:hypothetical protein